jgi:chemotaxis signal transduction protein
MPIDLMLIISTNRHRYAIRRDDVLEIRLVPDTSVMPRDEQGRPYLGVELGPLLDPDDYSDTRRRRALVVPLRRRLVALLADSVDSFHEQAIPVPLPQLLGTRLSQPWAIGVLVLADEVIVQLDLRAVARSALAHRSSQN